jgi:hypothetical protein
MNTLSSPNWHPAVLAVLGLFTAACGPARPPADFAPAPELLSEIREIRIYPGSEAACPGQIIRASYTAVLNSGAEVPFSTTYDDDRPPPLHVVMLRRTSPDATPRENGDWDTAADPVQSVLNGFRLSAFLRQKPSLNTFTTVTPYYDCLRHAFSFRGRHAGQGTQGETGPDVTVRIGIVSSPFYERLLVAGIEVGAAPPRYVFADPDYIPPADWLLIASQGGNGGAGVPGSDGGEGTDGEPGCPGSAGGPGGAGGNGGPGGAGGRGGRLTVIAPEQEPFLAGLVDGQSVPGEGGKGGEGGAGGAGGVGGEAQQIANRRCRPGANGADGRPGANGPDGPDGGYGPRPETVLLPLNQVFGPRAPFPIVELLAQGSGR